LTGWGLVRIFFAAFYRDVGVRGAESNSPDSNHPREGEDGFLKGLDSGLLDGVVIMGLGLKSF
jgi:hypothetical protein